jgi:hypothetical protein
MKKFTLALTIAAAVTFAPVAALANSVPFGYTFTGNDGVVATGVLYGTSTGSGAYDITSGTISLTGAPACNNCGGLSGPLDGTGVFVTDPRTGVFQTGGGTQLILDGTDSLLYPDSSQLIDNSGVFLFQMDSGLGVGLFSNEPGGPGYGMFGGNWTLDDSGSLSLAPEPSSMLLLGTGLVGLAGIVRRRLLA